MTTIQDVARHAHVGAATVSRVLNGSGYVKEETREKILRAIKELNYTPNEMARNLYHRKSGIVAIIVPEVSHPYFAEFINSAEIALYSHGYQSMICNTWREQNYETHYLELLKQQRVDGIITGVHTLDIEQYQTIDRPIVALDRQLGEKIPCVAVNHEKGGRMAAEALIEAGCKKVLQCTGVRRVSTPSNVRHEIFEQVMKEHGIPCYNYLSKWNGFEYSDYKQAAEEIADKYMDIDGFFATDIMAVSLIHAMESRGRKYAEDFKVVAYDGTFVSSLPYPSLTTVVQPIEKLAVTCVDILMELIQGKVPEKKNIKLDVTFRQGQSTKSF
ncbi:MAG: LacI family DNA-binding transcriptional regulator [Eubacteriales bacterium]|nr:LacI family DNA-binding transcriptional regulator [Eubacteriales bacterium]